MSGAGDSHSFTPGDGASVSRAVAHVRRYLLDRRVGGDHWEGELSSSALSTATALFALALYARQGGSQARHSECERLVRGGAGWLVRHQNEDGGWGDTLLSMSNISTTVLCWAALTEGGEEAQEAVRRAEAWLVRAAGSLAPEVLAREIADRYGKDRTFSVPILTMCALAGRLGPNGWRLVPGLPFELAACPQAWFRWLRLPVVSYALPALIAIGQVGHHHWPTRNPGAHLARELARGRTLGVLSSIQPEGGGFLEATPLTSFVTMSLVGSGQADHPVVQRGVEFLVRSARPDGSWPIDTNLSTWVTTLAVNALSAGSALEEVLSIEERGAIRDWLLRQQYREVHPYTRAEPGGWAWTDLPGGVPDADDTAGALLALRNLGLVDADVRDAARAGVRWLLNQQNRDGGIPTFCRGWGALPFDRSGADLTAHALLAWSAWRAEMPPELAARVDGATRSGIGYLSRTQRKDGRWIPLWFGNQHAPGEENPTYGTARVLPALLELSREQHPGLARMVERGTEWLVEAQNQDGGWGGDRGAPSSVEETALAVHALARLEEKLPRLHHAAGGAVDRGVAWLEKRTDYGRQFEPAPIGFYFARLWYFEQLYAPIMLAAALSTTRGRSETPPGGPSPSRALPVSGRSVSY